MTLRQRRQECDTFFVAAELSAVQQNVAFLAAILGYFGECLRDVQRMTSTPPERSEEKDSNSPGIFRSKTFCIVLMLNICQGLVLYAENR